jgi:hypothetical protein
MAQLPDDQAKFAELVGRGLSQEEASRFVGVAGRTGRRWMTRPLVQEEVESWKRRLFGNTEVVLLLEGLEQSDDPRVAMAALVLKDHLGLLSNGDDAKDVELLGGAYGAAAGGRNPHRQAADPYTGSMREILQARIRDPKTSSRDLAALVNTFQKLNEEQTEPGLESYHLPDGTKLIFPDGSEGSIRDIKDAPGARRGPVHRPPDAETPKTSFPGPTRPRHEHEPRERDIRRRASRWNTWRHATLPPRSRLTG